MIVIKHGCKSEPKRWKFKCGCGCEWIADETEDEGYIDDEKLLEGAAET